MKKRVHLHQLRVGMYVEEIEGVDSRDQKARDAFMISSTDDIERIMHCNAMSAVINVRKGADVDGVRFSPPSNARMRFETQILREYSEEEITRAKATIAKTAPQVQRLLQTVHAQNTVDMGAASTAVGEIMTSTTDNPGALINLSKLKDKDEGTFLHCLSVSALLITFGRTLNLGEDTVRLLGIGGLVHDVGKMRIPVAILQKNGKLTDQETAIIRSHPDRGYDLLKQVEGIEPIVLDICLHHHEKFDGSGYPDRLAGEAIPYAARLAAICDVYDALTSVRPYKKPWSQAEAIKMMLGAHGHFDPELMKLFVSRMIVSGKIT